MNSCVFYFYKLIGKLTFFAGSGVDHAKPNRGQFHYKRTSFYSQLKSKVGLVLAKDVSLRITPNIDGAPIGSRSHTLVLFPSETRPYHPLTKLSTHVPPRFTCYETVLHHHHWTSGTVNFVSLLFILNHGKR